MTENPIDLLDPRLLKWIRQRGWQDLHPVQKNAIVPILKSSDQNPESCSRFTFAYEKPIAGEGRFIHTYMGDGNPLPSFEGEPKRVKIEGDIDSFTKTVWESLNEENKVSLFVRFIDVETGAYETRIVNKNQK